MCVKVNNFNLPWCTWHWNMFGLCVHVHVRLFIHNYVCP